MHKQIKTKLQNQQGVTVRSTKGVIYPSLSHNLNDLFEDVRITKADQNVYTIKKIETITLTGKHSMYLETERMMIKHFNKLEIHWQKETITQT